MHTRTVLFPDDSTPVVFIENDGTDDLHLEFGTTDQRVMVVGDRDFFDRLYEALGEGK